MKHWLPMATAVVLSGLVWADSWTEGNKTVLIIPVDFSDAPGYPTGSDKISMSNNLAIGIANISEFYRRCSLGKCTMTGVIAIHTNETGVFRMPQPASYYSTNNNSNFAQLLADANAAAKAVNPAWDRNLCDRLVVTITDKAITSQGLAYVGWSGVAVKGFSASADGGGYVAHELGHNHGANHANFARSQDGSVLNSPGSVEYGNPFDVMGGVTGQFGVKFKELFDWLIETDAPVDGRYLTVTNSGIYRLYAHDDTNTLSGGYRLLRVTTNRTDTLFNHFWLGLRQRQFTTNTNSFYGVHVDYNALPDNKTHLLDLMPVSASDDATDVLDAPLTLGRTLSDRRTGIHITPLGKTGTVPEAMDIAIQFGLFTNNVGPTNLVLTASTNAVAPGQPVQVTASASDPDGDTLAYSWTFGDGRFGPLAGNATNASSQTVSWTTPGEYAVRCVASDMKGGTASRTVVIRVGVTATPRYRIYGRVLRNGQPVEGVQVYVSSPVPASKFYYVTHTDTDGSYVIPNLEAGTYTVKTAPDQSDAYATPASRTVVLGPGNAYGVDFFAGSEARFTISGTISSGSSAMAGVTVSDGFRSAVSAANGSFIISNVPNGTYVLTATKEPYSFRTVTATVANANVTGKQIYTRQAEVLGYVWGASNTFTISINDGIASHTTTTYPAGSTNAVYWFYPAMGNWNFTATASGFSAVPQNFSNPTNVTDTGSHRLDFAVTNLTRYTITGTVTEQGQPRPGVRIVAGTQTNYTDGFGKYILVNLTNGTYTVTPSLANYVFSPGSRTVTINNANQTGQDFTATNTLNNPPTIVSAASCTPNPVPTTTATLSVLGADDGGEGNLTYTWSQLSGPANVAIAPNGNNAAKNATVTFYKAGSYSLRATVRDSGGLTNTSTVAVTVNATPAVLAIAPYYSVVLLNQTQQFVATAWDQFGETNSPAVTWSVSNGGTIDAAGRFVGTVPGGPYTVTGISGTLTAAGFVSVNEPPTVSLLTPTNGHTVAAPATITLTAAANDPDGSIASVAYLVGTNLIGSATTPPYSVLWRDVLPGSYAVYARAADNLGAIATSTVANVTVTGTFITWTGSVNTNWDTTTLNWTNPPNAVAYTEGDLVRFTDVGVTLGNTNIFIQPAGVAPAFVQVTNTTAKTFVISGGDLRGSTALVKSGAGWLVFTNYTAGPSYSGGTTIRGGVISLQPPTGGGTCYLGTGPVTLDGGTFRYHGNNNNASGTITNRIIVTSNGGTLATGRGDGTIYSGDIELGGTLRHVTGGGGGYPARRITGTTIIDQSAADIRRIIMVNTGNGNAVISGAIVDGPGTAANPLRISTSGSTSNRHLEVSAVNTFSGGAIIEAGPARVILTSGAQLGTGNVTVETNAVLELNGPSNIAPTAALDIAGVVSIAPNITNTVANLLTNGVPLPPGIYSSANLAPFLTNSGAIRVLWPNQPPTVLLTAPTNGAVFAAPANILLSAIASDPDGIITNVAFYNGPTLIAAVATSPYSVIWSNVSVGGYSLWAIATDNAGASATSAVVSVTVAWPYELWRTAKFTADELLDPAISGDTADPDGDGLPNLLEYALGFEPKQSSSMPCAVLEGNHLTLTYTRRVPPTDVSYEVQATSSLTGGWSTNGITEQVLGSDGIIQTNKATDGASVSNNLSRFIRLKVTQP